jgi:hypothetical protein
MVRNLGQRHRSLRDKRSRRWFHLQGIILLYNWLILIRYLPD